MDRSFKALKSLLKRVFAFLGLEKDDLKLLRSLSTLGVVVGFSATVSALLFPRFPAAFYSFVLGDLAEEVMSALVVEEQLFSIIAGFFLLSTSAILHFLFDIYLGSLEKVSSYSEKSKLRMIVLSTFFLSFVVARVAVILSGIVGPETAGPAFFIPVNEIWVSGYHIHHFFFGFAALISAGWLLLFREGFSKKYAAVLYGTGLGIFMDEFGMLLTEGDYFATSSYFAAITFLSLLLVGVYWDHITAEA
ncbi:hypothetical protein ACK3SF_05685 [Candidatus Nanosalina sp. VS9-1]|uniref:hypothetical protein n=1 Tax=Candidatus Nanosalina sp. VS9-1 TaxID=3388566 RepID=UPI0039DFCB5F